MKRIAWVWTAVLLVLLSLPFSAFAESVSALDLIAGPLEATLPEDAVLMPGKTFDEYIVSWEPLEDVFEYRFMGFWEVELNKDGKPWKYWEAVGGWMGDVEMEDGEGKKHLVSNASFENTFPALGGAESGADFVALVNEMCTLSAERMRQPEKAATKEILGYYLHVVIIPISGEPVVQAIALPVETTISQ